MPRMDAPPRDQTLAKLLLIGDSKIGKTYYAGLAAKAGFNVLYVDGDVGAQTIASMVKDKVLSPEEASRIYLLDVGDTIAGGLQDTKFLDFMNEFIGNTVTRWNDTDHRIATRRDTDKEVWEIRPGLMGPNDLLIIDSWTGYVESLMRWVARANGVDIPTATTEQMRPVYQGGAQKTAELGQVIRCAPCNILVLAHPDEYVHMTAPEGKKLKDIKEKDKVVDWTKLIPKTTSKPQGLLLGKYFTDVAWMELSPAGNERRLSFKPDPDRVGGGHFKDTKSVDEYSFLKLVEQIGGHKPTGEGPDRWLRIIPPAEASAEPEPATPAESKVLDGTKPSQVKGPGMASLFARKPDSAAAGKPQA